MTTKSFIQTAEVYMPKSTNKFLTMKQAPPRIKFEVGEWWSKTQYDEDLKMKVYWDPDGTIRIEYDTGVLEIYPPKPTLADMFKRSHTGEYLRIHTDGSVEHGYETEYYYWGPDEDVEWNMGTQCERSKCNSKDYAYFS